MDDLFHIGIMRRVSIIRKLLFRKNPFLIIPRKPLEMIQARPEDHVIRPVKDAIDFQRNTIDELKKSLDEFTRIYFSLVDKGEFDEGGGHFGGIDAACAYAMVRIFMPKTILEVGCGQSTHVMRRALIDSEMAHGKDCQIVCVDPAPRKSIVDVADEMFRENVLNCNMELFENLESGDFLFIDGSHYSFNGTDVSFLFLEVLPNLKKGVIIHVHDICLPYEYPREFTQRLYNEQYVLAPMVMDRDSWEVLLPVYAETREGRFGDVGAGGSFWLRRVGNDDQI